MLICSWLDMEVPGKPKYFDYPSIRMLWHSWKSFHNSRFKGKTALWTFHFVFHNLAIAGLQIKIKSSAITICWGRKTIEKSIPQHKSSVQAGEEQPFIKTDLVQNVGFRTFTLHFFPLMCDLHSNWLWLIWLANYICVFSIRNTTNI